MTIHETCRVSCLHCWAQVLVNAGQANAATGDAGYEDCVASAGELAKVLGISEKEVRSPPGHLGWRMQTQRWDACRGSWMKRKVLQHVCMLELGIKNDKGGPAMHPALCCTCCGHQQCRGISRVYLVLMHPCSPQVLLLSTGGIGLNPQNPSSPWPIP